MKITNFNNLSSDQKKALEELFTNNPFKDLFPIGNNDKVELGYRILRHFNSKAKISKKKWPQVRYEVLDNEAYLVDNHSSYYKSLNTLSLTNKNALSIKIRKPGKERVVKDQKINYEDRVVLRQVSREAHFMEGRSFFHSKPLVRGESSTFIVMRPPSELSLDKFLEQTTLSCKQRLDLSIALVTALKTQIHSEKLVHRNLKPENIHIKCKDDVFEVFIYDYSCIIETSCKDAKDPQANATTMNDIYLMGTILTKVWGAVKVEDIAFKMDMPTKKKHDLRKIIKEMCDKNQSKRPNADTIIERLSTLVETKAADTNLVM